MGLFSSWLNSLATSTPGGTVYNGIVIQDGVPKKTPALQFGAVPRLYINAPGRDLTLSDTRSGILTSASSGTTIFKIPTMYAMGFVRNAANPMEITLLLQRGGTGPLIMGYHLYLGLVNAAAMVLLNPVSIGDYVRRSDDSNAVYRLTALPASSSGNWTKITGSPTNLPTAAGIVVQWNDHDPQYLPKDHDPVLLTSNGLDSWVAS